MNKFTKILHRTASSLLFHAARFVDQNLWTSHGVSETLAFRDGWKTWRRPTPPAAPVSLWIHGASVGELEDLAAFYLSESALAAAGLEPQNVMITAASASAKSRLEQWARQLPFAYCGPLPPDTPGEARDFLQSFEPENLLLSHNDFWPNLFFEWRQSPTAKTFFWYFKPKKFSTTRARSFAALNPRQLDRSAIGNLRLDRILARIADARRGPHALAERQVAPAMAKAKPSIIVGSCRLGDARVIHQFKDSLFTQYHWVVIPHNTQDIREMAQISELLGQRVSVIGQQGILLESYRDFDLAWVGGGFSESGSHNSLEALAWGVPVICGPNTRPQIDTPLFEASGALRTFADAPSIEAFLQRGDFLTMQASARRYAAELSLQTSGVSKLAAILAESK